MPFKSLITASIESILNTLFYRSPILKRICQRLNGKIFRILLKEFKIPLVFFFSEDRVDVLNGWEGQTDCSVTTHLNELLKLRNYQQLTALIRSSKLEIEGDIQLAQNFFALIDIVEFDFIEFLAPYTGDAVAEGIRKVFLSGVTSLLKRIQRQHYYTSKVLTEEWRIAAGKLEVTWFIKEVAMIERAVNMLIKRTEKLEVK